MNAAFPVMAAVLLFCVYLGIRARKGKHMDLEQWTVGGRGFGTMFVFFINGGRNIHDLHIPRRKRMGLRKRRPGLLYYRVRLPCLHFVILASASRVDLRQTTQTDVAIRFFYFKIQQPAPRHSRIARRHRIPHPLSRSAAERARINCFSNVIRTDSALRRCLDRRCLHHNLCDDFRNPRFSVDIRRQRYHDFRHRPVFRYLSAHSLLRRVYGDVQTN